MQQIPEGNTTTHTRTSAVRQDLDSAVRKAQEKHEQAIIQAVAVALQARNMQARHIASPQLFHQHHLDRLLYLRSGSFLLGPNIFVGIGRSENTTDEIEAITTFLSYEVAWNEVDQVEDDAKTLRFGDLPWPFEKALVTRTSENDMSRLQVKDFPTTPDKFIHFICSPRRAIFYGISAPELLLFERRIWAREFFNGKVLGKVHTDDVDIVKAAYALMYAMISESEDALRKGPHIQQLCEKFVSQMKEWYSKHE